MSAAPILLLPGLICDARVWSPLRARLLGRDVRPEDGFGVLDTFSAMAQRVLRAAPPRFILGGHSMGARVALEVYRRAPERVVALLLASTGTHMPRAGEAEKRHALLDVGRSAGIAALVDQWLPPMIAPARRTDSAFVAPIRAMCEDAGVDAYAAQITALLGRPSVDTLLPAIRCPTFVAVGADDEWSPPEQHEAMAAAIPDASLHIFAGAGHMLPMEAPDALAEALDAWLTTAAISETI